MKTISKSKSSINYIYKEKLHNLKVKVVGTQAEVYLDDVLSLTTTLPSTVAEDGYISIVTVNNGATLDNFMITELDASGNPVTKLTTSSVTDTPSTGDTNNTLKVQKVGDDWTWPVIGVRQNFPGKYFLDDGLGVFMQDEGKATFWGSTEVGGPYEGSANSSYSKNATHTIKIRAVNDLVTVFVDGKQANEKSFSSLEREGYITLMSVNTEAVFDDFSITKLDDDGNPTAIIEQEISSAVDSASFSSDGTDLSEAVSGESTSSEDTASIDKGVYLGELETGNNGGSTALWIFVIVSDIVIIGGAAAVYIFLILPRLPKK